MKFSILIIDDEWDDTLENRKNGYERLAKEISTKYPTYEIIVDFLEKPDRTLLRTQLNTNQYAAVITDAVLNGKWENFTIADVMEILDNKIPIAVISKRWDETNASEIGHAWEKPNCRTFLHWRDIDPSGDGQIGYAIESVLKMIIDQKNLDSTTRLAPDEDVRIVHISDVHTGGITSSGLRQEAHLCADAILNHWEDKPPTFVAFTGDVTEYGAPSQYESGREWIAYFFKRLGLGELPARNLLYIPGNHDVNLCLAAASRIRLNKDEKTKKIKVSLGDEVRQQELIDYAYVPFRNFLKEICDCPLMNKDIKDHGLAWVEARFRHLGVIFYGINTAQPASAFDLPGREVSEDVLTRIREEIGDILKNCEDKPLIIGLGHHSPVAATGDGAVTNIDAFEKHFQGGLKTPLFLHGHSHKSLLKDLNINDVRLVISCAPTFTKPERDRPVDTLRGFNLLTLQRTGNVVKSLDAHSFGWLDQKVSQTKEHFWKLEDGMFREANAPKV